MNETFSGRVWLLGDDIDTDIIIPTEYLALKTVRLFSSAPGTGLPDPARRHHCGRKELRLRLFS